MIILKLTKEIARQIRINISLNKIFTSLRLDDDAKNSFFKRLNIINVKTALRRVALNSLSLV